MRKRPNSSLKSIWIKFWANAVVWGLVSIFLPQTVLALNNPYATYSMVLGSESAQKCGVVPNPIVSLETSSQYRTDDKTRSTVDPEAQAKYEALVGPLREYQQQIIKWTNKFAGSRGGEKTAATCALLWLDEWAKADALKDLKTNQAQFNRDVALAALTQAYLQLGGAKLDDGSANRRIVEWFIRRASDSKDYYLNVAKERSRSNNHSYWAAVAVAGSAIAANDTQLFAWPMSVFQSAVCSATSDGALPYELARGKRARLYHLFALGPLITLAEFGEHNRANAYATCDHALDRIVAFTLRSIDDPAKLEALANEPQEKFANGMVKGNQVAWLEPYLKRMSGNDVLGWRKRIEQLRPVKSTALGGDLTLLYR